VARVKELVSCGGFDFGRAAVEREDGKGRGCEESGQKFILLPWELLKMLINFRPMLAGLRGAE
jgi:hypothetical protein